MGGVYGQIDSHDDFFRILADARKTTKRLLARHPGQEALEAIDAQLDAVSRWTANGRGRTTDDSHNHAVPFMVRSSQIR